MKVLLLLSLLIFAHAGGIEIFKFDKSSDNDERLLIISGIQGDEPGGFNATSILIKHYQILSGNLWVIPKLNERSIMRNHRGIYGDMNRKFSNDFNSRNDPDGEIVEEVKSIILNPKVTRILHLHDGSGFYREQFISNELNPNRWGNSTIIDRKTLMMDNDLFNIAKDTIDYINLYPLNNKHIYRIRNTNTHLGDLEQEKSLTYFSINNSKMAIANEASKSLNLAQRIYYHLLGIEANLNSMNIKFKRNFDLNIKNIQSLIYDKSTNIIINGLDLNIFELRNDINFFPMNIKYNNINYPYSSNTPIVLLFKDANIFKVKHGNKVIARFNPLFIEFDDGLKHVKLSVDNEIKHADINSVVKVKDSFLIHKIDGYRVNVIGFQKQGLTSEDNIQVKKEMILKRFSIDKNLSKFRVEFYRGKKYAGMLILEFI